MLPNNLTTNEKNKMSYFRKFTPMPDSFFGFLFLNLFWGYTLFALIFAGFYTRYDQW